MANGDNINKKAYEEALKAAEKLTKEYEKGLKNIKSTQDAFAKISSQLFGISGAAFFKEVPKTVDELKQANQEVKKIKDNLTSSFEGVSKDLKSQFKDVFDFVEAGPAPFDTTKYTSTFNQMAELLGVNKQHLGDLDQMESDIAEKFGKHSDEHIKFLDEKKIFEEDSQKHQKHTEDFYKKAVELNTDFLADLTEQEKIDVLRKAHMAEFNASAEDAQDAFHKMAIHSNNVSESTQDLAYNASVLKSEMPEIIKDLESANKRVFSMAEGFKDIGKNFAADIIPSIMEYDQAISDAGRDFGFVETKTRETSFQMAQLNSEAARFGMSAKDTLQMMGDLGDELKTIDQKYLAESVGHFIAIQKATGISSEEVTTIAGEMMRAGKSAGEVEEFMDESNKIAKQFGVNTKKALQGVSRNIDKMRQMGFQGGEESLTKMVATAERLRMNVDEIFDVAKKARTIEGAMDMAAELQLAGGSFAAINPMDLLAAARKGPKELQNILTKMGGDIGSWNEKTGEFQFDPVDVDRLQMVADATGQSLDSIQKMIQKNAEDNKKTDLLGLSAAIGEDERNFLSDMTKIGEGGKIEMSDELTDLATSAGLEIKDVQDLKNLSQDDMKLLMDKKAANSKNIEEQALANQSLSESIQAFKDSVLSLFAVFEPFIAGITDFIQMINNSNPIFKGIVAGLIGFIAVAPRLMGGFAKFKEGAMAMTDSFKGFMSGKGLSGKMKGLFGKATPDKATIPGADSTDMTPKGGKEGGGLKTLAQGLKAMGEDFGTVMKGILATAAAGPALLLLLPGVPTILAMAAVGALGKLVEFGFRSLGNGIGLLGKNMSSVLKGSLAMIVIGASLIPFAFALSMMTDISWKAVIAGLGFLLVSAGIIIALGAIMTSGIGAVAILLGAAAMIVIAAAVLVFAVALQQMVPAAEALSSIGFGWMMEMGLAMLLAAPGLMLGGLALLVASPGLVLGSVGLMVFAEAAKAMADINWESFSAMGPALLSAVPGMLAFSLASLAFLNPLALLGFAAMTGTLGGLAMVMVPLATSLDLAATSMDRFAQGLEKLQSAANSLDFKRLEALKELSSSFAMASVGGGMGDTVDKIAKALEKLSVGGGAGGGGTKKIQIDLKLNGRDVQKIIVNDTEIIS